MAPGPSDSADAPSCPQCGSPGVLFSAGMVDGRPGLIRLGLRCWACRNEWELEVKAEAFPQPPQAT